jgi:GNAT superfamily N-acetyltransferase
LDLPAINSVIEQALASWDTAERVKRLALPVYRYQPEDLDHMWLLAAESTGGELVGVAALEEADGADLPQTGPGLLLHGIYVRPEAMGMGIGGRLVEVSAGIVRALGYDGLLVKSVRQSRGFFERCGLRALHQRGDKDYPYRYWLPAGSGSPDSAHPHTSSPLEAAASMSEAR